MNSIIKKYLKSILYQISKPILGRLCKFNGIHKGESCYIFGDGESVKYMDLSLFSDKTSIAVNNFPFHKDFNTINCYYCINNSPYYFSPYFGYPPEKKRHLYEMSKIYKNLIVSNPQINYFISLSNYPFLRGSNIFYTFRNFTDPRLSADFIGNRINCFSGVCRASIMLAIYLGFDQIYLVGFDYTHVPSRNLHWYEKGTGVFVAQENYQKDFFEIAKEFINITTITLDATSDFINAMTYEEHTGCKPIYRENTDLIDDKYLKVLSTWPDLAIY